MTISESQVMFTRTVTGVACQKQDISLNLKVPPAQVCSLHSDINLTQKNLVGLNKLYIGLKKRIQIMLSHYPIQYILYANNLIHVGLIEQIV